MKKFEFISNIKCQACINTVTPVLNNFPGIQSWNVDLQDPSRKLIIQANELDVPKLQEALKNVGYTITSV
ncbi:MAG: heavy-metal-associated domain-containing protein [Flavobacteriales bacterium]|nr:heavy-metal-associated domain-containing protein [Flavobacteriales bacterium]